MEDASGARILAGKYRLVHQLGKGGMGAVWLANHLTLQSPVAIKLIEPGIASNPEALARFLREARAAAALRSPHVVQILDHGVDEGTPYIAMELLEGESLADRLRKAGRLSPEDTARILVHTARAMSRAHEVGIVHRDLKPDNIFLIENEEEELAKVLDFGIAKSTDVGFGVSAIPETRTGALMGTLHYMSPEQAEGARSVDFRTDIWAMGVIAFECLVGQRPFSGETLGTLVLEICTRPLPVPSKLGPVPKAFDAWFAKACARDPAARFASAREAAAELRRICQPRGSATEAKETARPTNAPERSSAGGTAARTVGRRWLILGAGTIVGVGAAVFALRGPAGHAPTTAAVPSPPVSASAPPKPPGPVPPAAVAPAVDPPAPTPPREPMAAEPTGRSPIGVKPSPPRRLHHDHADKASATPAAKPSSAAAASSKPAPARPPAPPAGEKPKVNLGI